MSLYFWSTYDFKISAVRSIFCLGEHCSGPSLHPSLVFSHFLSTVCLSSFFHPFHCLVPSSNYVMTRWMDGSKGPSQKAAWGSLKVEHNDKQRVMCLVTFSYPGLQMWCDIRKSWNIESTIKVTPCNFCSPFHPRENFTLQVRLVLPLFLFVFCRFFFLQ